MSVMKVMSVMKMYIKVTYGDVSEKELQFDVHIWRFFRNIEDIRKRL